MAAPREELLRVLREIVAPLLIADGAEVYVVPATDDAFRIHLAGRYSGCPGNTLAVRHFVEPALLTVSAGAQVVVTSGAIIPSGARKI